MMLYLCRHAIAADAKEGQPDELRPLTKEGIAKMRKAANGLVNLLGPKAGPLILTSPATRARQTAQLILQAIESAGGKASLRESKSLWTGDTKGFLKDIRAAKKPAILAVGHEPLLSHWITELCFQAASPNAIEFKKGAVAALGLAGTGPHAKLIWLLQPAILRELA